MKGIKTIFFSCKFFLTFINLLILLIILTIVLRVMREKDEKEEIEKQPGEQRCVYINTMKTTFLV